jgi:lysophospholipase L1-like esterase
VPLALVFEGPLLTEELEVGAVDPFDPTLKALKVTKVAHPRAVGPTRPRGNLVIGLGDSWFHYFAADIFDVFKFDLGFEALTLAEEGTRILEMAAQPRQLQRLDELIQAQGALGRWPCVILLSACGNDVVHPELQELLVERSSISDLMHALEPAKTTKFIDVELHGALTKVLTAIDAIAVARVGQRVPILIHGYAYPYPDGRGALGTVLPSWLAPSFEARGYTDNDVKKQLDERHTVMTALIDRLNGMQIEVAAELGKLGLDVRHIDLRRVLMRQADWQNELHPTIDGFKRVARRLAKEVSKEVGKFLPAASRQPPLKAGPDAARA